jgi:hypothetical protein
MNTRSDIETKGGSLFDKFLVDKDTGWMRSVFRQSRYKHSFSLPAYSLTMLPRVGVLL